MTRVHDRLCGITTPLVTPFDGTDIDWVAGEELIHHVVNGGVDAVFPCGTTGEFASITPKKRRQLVEKVVELTPSDVSVLAGGTGTSVEGAIDWIHTLSDIGVEGAVVTAPYFHGSNSPDGLRQFFSKIAESSPIPVILYNIPDCVGELIPVNVVADLASLDSVIGLKDSSGDLSYGMRVDNETPEEFLLLQGYDPLLLPSLRMGFHGGVNALSNVVPSVYAELVHDPKSHRSQLLHQEVIEPLFDMCQENGFAPAAKAGLVARGVLQSPAVRPPLTPVDSEKVQETIEHVETVL